MFQDDGSLRGRGPPTAWDSPVGLGSCEIEGHPLGGGMLKLDPGEVRNVVLAPDTAMEHADSGLLHKGVEVMRRWRDVG